MSKQEHRDLFEGLKLRGLLEYGSVILSTEVHEILGMKVPAFGTKAEFDAFSLRELGAIDHVRNVLLGQGKYLAGTRSGYRVLLPSENAEQVEHYISSADRKLSRALKLSRNTPRDPSQSLDQTEARIAMKQQGVRSRSLVGRP